MRKSMISIITLVLLAVILVACSDDAEESQNENDDGWSESPVFEVGEYEVIGKEERLAIDHIPFVAGENEQYVMYFWGEQEELMNGPVKIEAFHEDDEEKKKAIVDLAGTENEEKIWEATAPQIGKEQAHLPLVLSLPTEGVWRLDVYLGDEMFDHIYVKVQASEEA
ncbi:DUF4871 domain-containing protein [Allobacillus sp. GCM10007491]|uniref:DUF4871 domain-containing protein n=1 Tax=Allobacillus saliphilus TaxID=2912308 RepID=A0A941CTE5_9BACI|nr:DUF4871 domain-containing protein [Allobacillus saliphilus]MBR7553482.1 DUF4871 domain-containing protein [Allobacillus saliphilus]